MPLARVRCVQEVGEPGLQVFPQSSIAMRRLGRVTVLFQGEYVLCHYTIKSAQTACSLNSVPAERPRWPRRPPHSQILRIANEIF